MYLIINGTEYTCSKRVKEKNYIKYYSVTPEPTATGILTMCRNDGFVLCEDNLDSFEYKEYSGTTLLVYNGEKPQPPDPTKKPEYRISVLENTASDMAEKHLATEQSITDLDIANIEIQQAITELELMQLEG